MESGRGLRGERECAPRRGRRFALVTSMRGLTRPRPACRAREALPEAVALRMACSLQSRGRGVCLEDQLGLES